MENITAGGGGRSPAAQGRAGQAGPLQVGRRAAADGRTEEREHDR